MSVFDFFSSKPTIIPVVLVIIDGFGIAPPSRSNPIDLAKTPNFDHYKQHYPYGELLAAGEAVGLPAGSPGNSEVGHLTIGTGRVVYQSVAKINKAIEDSSFYDNSSLLEAINYTKTNKSHLHLIGLAGQGVVHSDINHLKALLQLCQQNGIFEVRLHLFTDGRDAPPQAGHETLKEIQELTEHLGIGSIVTVSGRYYAMDRDAHWERIQLTYEAVVCGRGERSPDISTLFDQSYTHHLTDEFIKPTIIDPKGTYKGINEKDAVIFINFRADRARELTMSVIMPDFETSDHAQFGLTKKNNPPFHREHVPKNIFSVTMTEYHPKLPVNKIAFPQEIVTNDLSQVLTQKGLAHAHLAESEKERMVTYYFKGFRDQPLPLEEVKIVPSLQIPRYDKAPEMSLFKIVNEFKKYIRKNRFSFIMMNFANPDMVGHTGNKPATIHAIQAVDQAVKTVVDETLKRNGTVLITADHGNAEEILSFTKTNFFYTTEEGEMNTQHSLNPVPIHIISNQLLNQKRLLRGTLSDVAPTILGIFHLEKPAEMTGLDLLNRSNTTTLGTK